MKLFVFLVTLYLALDFADPGMQGALNFNPDESVEAVHLQRLAPVPSVLGVPTSLLPFARVNMPTTDRTLVSRSILVEPRSAVCFAPPRRIPPPPDDLPS